MGIGNLVERGPPFTLLLLITPHGDWKHPGPRHRPAYAGSSLPLMGIGNRICSRIPKLGRKLITPHGDWKQGPGRAQARRALHPHYPSWGLETSVTNIVPSRSILLITPHGDWKPYVSRSSSGRLVAHYPSWGLETLSVYRLMSPATATAAPSGGVGSPYLRRAFYSRWVLQPSAHRSAHTTDQSWPCHRSFSCRMGPPAGSLLSRMTSVLWRFLQTSFST